MAGLAQSLMENMMNKIRDGEGDWPSHAFRPTVDDGMLTSEELGSLHSTIARIKIVGISAEHPFALRHSSGLNFSNPPGSDSTAITSE
jgi:hypothetical protein